MAANELYAMHTTTVVSRKKKGAGKGYKTSTRTVWRDGMALHNYMTELEELDKIAYGLELCRVEYADMTLDRWWDCDACRKSEVKSYRSRIAAIRKEYGLNYEAVADFYNVG